MSSASHGFDPAAPADDHSGLFGMSVSPEHAIVHILPVPFDGTTSYGDGARHGPNAILAASHQLDLYDLDFGRPYEAGICMLPEHEKMWLCTQAGQGVAARRRAGREIESDREHINQVCGKVNEFVREQVIASLNAKKVLGLLGGDHGTPFAYIDELAQRHPGMGILHIDAHHDLRLAYEGFTWSHASIMRNVIDRVPNVAKLVSLGIRDFSEEEMEFATAQGDRIVTYYDRHFQERKFEGQTIANLCQEMIAPLPEEVYISFDIDGLNPHLCPNTGTPVAGGFEFTEAIYLLKTLVKSGRRIIGFDLCEVAPSQHDTENEWDANVGARVLYALIGATLASRQS